MRPANGRSTTAPNANAPTAIPTPMSSAPKSRRANTGSTAIVVPSAMKYSAPESVTSANWGVTKRARSGATSGIRGGEREGVVERRRGPR